MVTRTRIGHVVPISRVAASWLKQGARWNHDPACKWGLLGGFCSCPYRRGGSSSWPPLVSGLRCPSVRSPWLLFLLRAWRPSLGPAGQAELPATQTRTLRVGSALCHPGPLPRRFRCQVCSAVPGCPADSACAPRPAPARGRLAGSERAVLRPRVSGSCAAFLFLSFGIRTMVAGRP